jgi:hypothetical protein
MQDTLKIVKTREPNCFCCFPCQVRHAACSTLVSVSELLTQDDLGQHVLTIVLVNSTFDLMLLSSLA